MLVAIVQADVVVEKQAPLGGGPVASSLAVASERLEQLEAHARADLASQGFAPQAVSCTRFLNCRYEGTDMSIMTSLSPEEVDSNGPDGSGSDSGCEKGYEEVFVRNYRREFGFELIGRRVLVDDVRVRAVGHASSSTAPSAPSSPSSPPSSLPLSASTSSVASPECTEVVSVYFHGGRVATPVFSMADLRPLQTIPGPAIIIQDITTIIIEPDCQGEITKHGDLKVVVLASASSSQTLSLVMDPIYLSIFSHRFMGIAEQMGRTLQRTSISVNIKERLDFSCALFDEAGGLVANAPHLPVHLGAMSEAGTLRPPPSSPSPTTHTHTRTVGWRALISPSPSIVRYQVKYWGSDLEEGDVLVSNHPQLAGGSHLPDITVITPIFRCVTCGHRKRLTGVIVSGRVLLCCFAL